MAPMDIAMTTRRELLGFASLAVLGTVTAHARPADAQVHVDNVEALAESVHEVLQRLPGGFVRETQSSLVAAQVQRLVDTDTSGASLAAWRGFVNDTEHWARSSDSAQTSDLARSLSAATAKADPPRSAAAHEVIAMTIYAALGDTGSAGSAISALREKI